MWTSTALAAIALILLVNPGTRKNENILSFAVVAVFFSTWIDKGMGLVVGGFIPNPLEHVVEYTPTLPEVMITLGVWAIGFLILTVLFKIAVTVKEQTAS
jgi:molybdopterin-containing oxidoreductase family membrane subunit